VRLILKLPVTQLHTDIIAQHMVRPQPGAYGFTEGEQDLAGAFIVRYIPGKGDAVAIRLIDRFLFSHRIIINAIGVLSDEDSIFLAQVGLKHPQVAACQLSDGMQPQVFHFPLCSTSHKK